MAYISFLIFLTFRIFTAEQRQKRNPHFRFRQRLERTIHAMSKKKNICNVGIFLTILFVC